MTENVYLLALFFSLAPANARTLSRHCWCDEDMYTLSLTNTTLSSLIEYMRKENNIQFSTGDKISAQTLVFHSFIIANIHFYTMFTLQNLNARVENFNTKTKFSFMTTTNSNDHFHRVIRATKKLLFCNSILIKRLKGRNNIGQYYCV